MDYSNLVKFVNSVPKNKWKETNIINKFGKVILRDDLIIPTVIDNTNVGDFLKSLGNFKNLNEIIAYYKLYSILSEKEQYKAYYEYEIIINDYSTFIFDSE